MDPNIDREPLRREVEAAIGRAGAERTRAGALCRQRADTWRNTLASSSEHAIARDESRARSNEAAYLADLIETDPALLDAGSPKADA